MQKKLSIALINMPFAAIGSPSLALAQLQGQICRQYPSIDCRIVYLNHNLADLMGRDEYERIANSIEATVSGFGDWFFRQAAFPEEACRQDEYFTRYPQMRRFYGASQARIREELPEILAGWIDRYRLDQDWLVGYTSMFMQHTAVLGLARLLKCRNPQVMNIAGGANFESPMGEVVVKNFVPIDFVFSGPALRSLPKFIESHLNGQPEECHALPGVYSRKKLAGSGADHLPEVGPELPIDDSPSVDHRDFDSSLRTHWPESLIPVDLTFETSRGCWWGERAHCTFCGLNGSTMTYRSLSSEKALCLFGDLFRRRPLPRRFFAVDNIMPKQYIAEVFPHLDTPPESSIFYEVKADLKETDVATLARAGVTELQPGIEALATSTLKLMRKGTTAFQNIVFLKSCRKHNVRPYWNLLVGFPGESESVFQQYVDWIPKLVHLPPPSGVYPVRFDRYSPYFADQECYGIELIPCDFYQLIYPWPIADLHRLAYYFYNRRFSAPYLHTLAKWMTRLQDVVQSWIDTARQNRPVLEIRRGGSHYELIDGRSQPSPQRSQLDDFDVAMLLTLQNPLSMHALTKSLAGWDLNCIESRLMLFRSRGLILEEDRRFLALPAFVPDDE